MVKSLNHHQAMGTAGLDRDLAMRAHAASAPLYLKKRAQKGKRLPSVELEGAEKGEEGAVVEQAVVRLKDQTFGGLVELLM